MTEIFDRDKLRDHIAEAMLPHFITIDGAYHVAEKVADVALAWVEAQMSEEWGQGRDARAVNRELREKTARWKAEGDPFGARAFRRLVTDWEPLEDA